jgi:hypothetical protein
MNTVYILNGNFNGQYTVKLLDCYTAQLDWVGLGKVNSAISLFLKSEFLYNGLILKIILRVIVNKYYIIYVSIVAKFNLT